jgi:hypothetical protein
MEELMWFCRGDSVQKGLEVGANTESLGIEYSIPG